MKRNLRLTKALEAARQLSGYIHHCIMQKNKSVWIAQREGRAKDSNDVTQDAVLKMLALAGEAPDTLHRLMELNIIPTSISYEYDPNDYLKAKEFLSRRRDPDFKKSQRDDLLSMETLGTLDINLYRDDWTSLEGKPHIGQSRITAPGDNAEIILIDDVLFSGRTIRAALEALLDYGRPRKVE